MIWIKQKELNGRVPESFQCGPINGGIYGLGPNEKAGFGWCYFAELGKREYFFTGVVKTKIEGKEKTESLIKEIIGDIVVDFGRIKK